MILTGTVNANPRTDFGLINLISVKVNQTLVYYQELVETQEQNPLLKVYDKLPSFELE